MKPAAVQSSFLIKWLCCIGGGRIVFEPLENTGVRINYFCNNAKICKGTMSVLEV